MQTGIQGITLSQAIAIQQEINWMEGKAKRAALQEAADRLEQTRSRITDAFWAWFTGETGIADMEDNTFVVSISEDYARSFPVLGSNGSVIYFEGVSVKWTLPSAPEVKIAFQGEFFERENGRITVAPERNGAWLVFRKDEPKLVAYSFVSAAIEALGLPYEKETGDANS